VRSQRASPHLRPWPAPALFRSLPWRVSEKLEHHALGRFLFSPGQDSSPFKLPSEGGFLKPPNHLRLVWFLLFLFPHSAGPSSQCPHFERNEDSSVVFTLALLAWGWPFPPPASFFPTFLETLRFFSSFPDLF